MWTVDLPLTNISAISGSEIQVMMNLRGSSRLGEEEIESLAFSPLCRAHQQALKLVALVFEAGWIVSYFLWACWSGEVGVLTGCSSKSLAGFSSRPARGPHRYVVNVWADVYMQGKHQYIQPAALSNESMSIHHTDLAELPVGASPLHSTRILHFRSSGG